jgi:hypothetical protein
MDKTEVELWKRNPVTQWLLQGLAAQFPLRWDRAETWEQVNRLKGQREVLEAIAKPEFD